LWSTKTSFAKDARMRESVCPPRRMRFPFESRCRIVQLVLEGANTQAAAATCGASRATGYRLSAIGYRLWRRYQEGDWAALADRPPVPFAAAAPVATGGGGSDPRGSFVRQCWPCDCGGVLGRPASTVWKVLRR
jgi:transposase-like protein